MQNAVAQEEQKIKCVVWDLDHTLWNGTLLEDSVVLLREGVADVLSELDRRGILCSIASKNDHASAWAKLCELGLDHYFLYPQIGWNPKSSGLRAIAKSLNIALDSFAFIDDQPFERAEVGHEIPEVLCLGAENLAAILGLPRMNPRFVTSESASRRELYLNDWKRDQAAAEYSGNNEAFLATLDMVFEIQAAREADLQRAEELTQRTHQLNTTGYTYSYDELEAFCRSPQHLLLVARLSDRFGPYGHIGLALVEKAEQAWTVKLLLMSCRVMSRGVGSVLINYLMRQAQQAGVTLRAEFVPNGKNRMMYVTYKFGGFKEIAKVDELIVLENDLQQIPPPPAYLQVCA